VVRMAVQAVPRRSPGRAAAFLVTIDCLGSLAPAPRGLWSARQPTRSLELVAPPSAPSVRLWV
jgi:hypothetical protein